MLTVEQRKEYFKELGLGEYNEANIKAVQKKYMERKSDVDGKYGQNTDNLIQNLYNVKKYTKNFKVEEFKCECGGRHCCGFPTIMTPIELIHIQTIRDHYGKPITVTCGMRCKGYNKELDGSIQNSLHLTGQAIDFYQQGVTDTLANRKKSIKYIKTLPHHHYTYGNGINSYGASVKASYMGNALHTDTYAGEPTPPIPPKFDKLVVDGIGGNSTVVATQRFFGTVEDGVISGQNKNLHKFYPSLTAVQFNSVKSTCVKKLQKWVGVKADGIIGEGTVKAWQKKLGVTADGIFGKDSMKAWQIYLNSYFFPDSTTPTGPVKPALPSDTVVDLSEFQDPPIDWVKAKADGVKGVIVRCGYRGAEKGTLNKDKHFLEHIKAAYKAGLKVGIYMFTEGITEAEGREEADYAIQMLYEANVPISYPVGVDTEKVNVKNERARNLTKEKRTEVIKGFCERIKEYGYEPMIYASTSWLNNKLDMSKLPYNVWVAQYNSVCEYKGEYVMWQYTSSGKIAGYSKKIDMNHCYLPSDYSPQIPKNEVQTPSEPTPEPTEPTVPVEEKNGYKGEYPSRHLVKTNAEVIEDTIRWLLMIAGNNEFHYGHGKHAHHNGCYFCNTETKFKKGHGIRKWDKTYCCNPFISAGWAHGGCVPEALKMCQKCDSYDFHKGKGYDKSKLFDNLGKLSKGKLKRGDVLCRDNHVMLYLGDGKVVHAHGGDDNVAGSKKWINSINVESLGDKRYLRVHRFNSSVDVTANIYHGEISKRVALLQNFLIWYGVLNSKYGADGIFGDDTFNAVKEFQSRNGLAPDGIVGEQTIAMMKQVKK